MPRIVVFPRVLLKIVSVLVYGVIGQMHKEVSKVTPDGGNILGRGETSQAFVVNKDPQRGHRRNQNVNAQIKLKTINQVRLVKVSLRDVVFIWLNPIVVSREENTFTLTTVFWFNYKCLCSPLIELLFELLDITGQDPSIWKEVEVLWEVLLHAK